MLARRILLLLQWLCVGASQGSHSMLRDLSAGAIEDVEFPIILVRMFDLACSL